MWLEGLWIENRLVTEGLTILKGAVDAAGIVIICVGIVILAGKETALYRSHIGLAYFLFVSHVIVWLVNDANAWSSFDSNSYN